MGIVRGKIWGPDYYPLEHYVGTSPLWDECDCGKWRDRRTEEHIEVTTYSLEELMDTEKPECPAQEKGERG